MRANLAGMQDSEKPPIQRFWTIDMIGLVALNIVFLAIIITACIGLFAGYYPLIAAWLGRVFGL
jgi:hypothetical protein